MYSTTNFAWICHTGRKNKMSAAAPGLKSKVHVRIVYTHLYVTLNCRNTYFTRIINILHITIKHYIVCGSVSTYLASIHNFCAGHMGTLCPLYGLELKSSLM